MRVESTTVRGDRDDLGALLVLSAQGDQVAFASVYDAVARRSYDLSLWVLGDRTLAEDAMCEALIDVWRCASRFDPSRGSGQAWILTVVYLTAVDRDARSSA
jgi:RNA polymerase sigma-70 factor, ECF subfamily